MIDTNSKLFQALVKNELAKTSLLGEVTAALKVTTELLGDSTQEHELNNVNKRIIQKVNQYLIEAENEYLTIGGQ